MASSAFSEDSSESYIDLLAESSSPGIHKDLVICSSRERIRVAGGWQEAKVFLEILY